MEAYALFKTNRLAIGKKATGATMPKKTGIFVEIHGAVDGYELRRAKR